MAAEREALAAYLDFYRTAVEMKCRGLTLNQARTRPMSPSTMSTHGLVRHLAGVERWWFQQNLERRDVPFPFVAADDPDLDDTARPLDWYEDVDLRWLVLRMITTSMDVSRMKVR